MTEPAPGIKIKAIAVPDFQPKKRRAGKRVKKQKDKVATTELRKQQNRMVFGEQESEVSFGDDVVGLGMSTKQVGKLRVVQEDKKVKASHHLSKRTRAVLAHSSTVSGLATSLAFTPVQGIELGDPELERKRREDAVKKANDRWFSG
jgi:U4/U6 small nuclear ribonucleoprotein PRP31